MEKSPHTEAQTLCRVISQRLADAQSQSENLEIKYSKAKRLLREYQSRHLDLKPCYQRQEPKCSELLREKEPSDRARNETSLEQNQMFTAENEDLADYTMSPFSHATLCGKNRIKNN
uniref:Uncharacterized protein n=1 Tax=Periophthalmus magnuspinnatus TaxID=409849 RepID=A0A3B3ZGW8_9GOBI